MYHVVKWQLTVFNGHLEFAGGLTNSAGTLVHHLLTSGDEPSYVDIWDTLRSLLATH